MAVEDDQQFCLRWNNFQANITSQFETLRDDEDFVDVTLACEGQRLEAHKVVLSACSPFFKELFKSNPCPHPIIFMQDVEAKHIVALLEFMYAGEVNVSQAHLSGFLRTAESLQIRGLTDASKAHKQQEKTTETSINVEQKPASPKTQQKPKPEVQNKPYNQKQSRSATSSPTQQPRKRVCKETVYESSNHGSENNDDIDTNSVEDFEVIEENQDIDFTEEAVEPKIELPGYISDEDVKSERLREAITGLNNAEIGHFTNINEEMEIIPGIPNLNPAEVSQDSSEEGVQILRSSLKRNSLRNLPLALDMSTSGISTIENSGLGSSSIFNNNDLMDSHRRQHCTCGGSQGHHGGLVKLGEGVEVCSEQLRGVKWTDWRKLTRGLATVLFSPLELATCSVTGQRWSRAGQHHRPVKPALPRDKVQAIVSYVANMFPNIEVSRIKQVLAYKCKENSTAFKMKSIRYYSDQHLQAQENQ